MNLDPRPIADSVNIHSFKQEYKKAGSSKLLGKR
jgi:hypothetical protein